MMDCFLTILSLLATSIAYLSLGQNNLTGTIFELGSLTNLGESLLALSLGLSCL